MAGTVAGCQGLVQIEADGHGAVSLEQRGGARLHRYQARGWVARLPQGWQPYALLARLDRPIGVWLLVLPGFWAFSLTASGWAEGLRLAALFAIGATAMRAAGCVVNDLWDRDIDRRVERTRGRPLAAGTVTPFQALVFLAALCLSGWRCCCNSTGGDPAGRRFAAADPALSAGQAGDQLAAGDARADLQLGGAGGDRRHHRAVGALALVLWAAAFLWILGYDTIYAHQDRADDAMVGIGSTALHWGERTRPFLAACYAGVVGLLLAAGVMAGLSGWFIPALALPAALLARQVVTLDIHDPAHCLRLFNRTARSGWRWRLRFWSGGRRDRSRGA